MVAIEKQDDRFRWSAVTGHQHMFRLELDHPPLSPSHKLLITLSDLISRLITRARPSIASRRPRTAPLSAEKLLTGSRLTHDVELRDPIPLLSGSLPPVHLPGLLSIIRPFQPSNSAESSLRRTLSRCARRCFFRLVLAPRLACWEQPSSRRCPAACNIRRSTEEGRCTSC